MTHDLVDDGESTRAKRAKKLTQAELEAMIMGLGLNQRRGVVLDLSCRAVL